MFTHLCKYSEIKNRAVIISIATLLLRGLDLVYFIPEFGDLVETHLAAVETDLCQWLEGKHVTGSNKFGGKSSTSEEILVC